MDINYIDISHMVSRQDGIEVVYKESNVTIDLELREVKEKQEFLALVSHNSKTFAGYDLVIQPEMKTDSVLVS